MQNGRVYSVVFPAVSISAIQDGFEFTPADDKPIELIGLSISQTGNSDVGDAQEEMIRWEVIRGNTVSGSGGSAPTPRPIKRGNTAAAAFTAEVNNTTPASSGTAITLHEDAFNVRSGQTFWWPEGCEPDASQADGTLCVRLPAAPADAITISMTAYVREYG